MDLTVEGSRTAVVVEEGGLRPSELALGDRRQGLREMTKPHPMVVVG